MKTIVEHISNFPIEITFYVGQNQAENFGVIDLGSEGDLWFHAANVPSCHVVMKLPVNTRLDKKQLLLAKKRAAVLCKQYTNKLSSQKDVEIIYAHIKDVKKTQVLGQVTTSNTKSLII